MQSKRFVYIAVYVFIYVPGNYSRGLSAAGSPENLFVKNQ